MGAGRDALIRATRKGLLQTGPRFKAHVGRTTGGQVEGPIRQQEAKDLNHSRKSGSVNEAIRVAKMANSQKRVAGFRNRFFALSSMRSRACKWAEILKLAKSIRGEGSILPLSRELVEAVRAP